MFEIKEQQTAVELQTRNCCLIFVAISLCEYVLVMRPTSISKAASATKSMHTALSCPNEAVLEFEIVSNEGVGDFSVA